MIRYPLLHKEPLPCFLYSTYMSFMFHWLLFLTSPPTGEKKVTSKTVTETFECSGAQHKNTKCVAKLYKDKLEVPYVSTWTLKSDREFFEVFKYLEFLQFLDLLRMMLTSTPVIKVLVSRLPPTISGTFFGFPLKTVFSQLCSYSGFHIKDLSTITNPAIWRHLTVFDISANCKCYSYGTYEMESTTHMSMSTEEYKRI